MIMRLGVLKYKASSVLQIRENHKDFNERKDTMSYLFCINYSSHLLAMQMGNGGILC